MSDTTPADTPPTSPPPPPPARKNSNYLLLGVNLVILLFAVYIVWNRMQNGAGDGTGAETAIATGTEPGRGTSMTTGAEGPGRSVETTRVRGAPPQGVQRAQPTLTERRLRGDGDGTRSPANDARLGADIEWTGTVRYDHDTRRVLAATERAIDNIGVQLEVYRAIHDTYPSSVGDTGANRGIEALVASLEKAGRTEGLLIGDSDADGARELVDLWGNPLVYFSTDDYGTSQDWTSSDGETATLGSPRSRSRDSYHAPEQFQLWSAGPDGQNDGGLGDDVTSWIIRE